MNSSVWENTFLLSSDLKDFQSVLEKSFENLSKRFKGVAANVIPEAKLNSPEDGFNKKEWEEIVNLGILSSLLPVELEGIETPCQLASVIQEQAGAALLDSPVIENIFSIEILKVLLTSNLDSAAKELLNNYLKKIALGENRFTFQILDNLRDKELSLISNLSNSTHLVVLEELPLNKSAQADNCPNPQLQVRIFSSEEIFINQPQVLNIDQNNKAILCNIRRFTSLDTSNISPVNTFTISFQEGSNSKADKKITEIFENLFHYRCYLEAWEIVGACRKILQITLDYVETRKQYSQKIGSFQAVQHKLSNCYVKLEELRSIGRFAADSLDKFESRHKEIDNIPKGERGRLTLEKNQIIQSFKLLANQYGQEIIEDCLQLHGGIGFTFEYDLHLYLRRVKTLAVIFGKKDILSEKLFQTFLS